ncbi:hypothetical protein WN944_010182 [Citrus x changshan-huyou]|uniref:Uncharacterized protein n=1 Tax=Citrus x changshan-huyou TaxID=2935761 RepID=A0AAP0MR65_9ROSI
MQSHIARHDNFSVSTTIHAVERVKNFEFFFYHSQFNFFMTLDNNLIKPPVKMAYHSAMGDITTSEAHIRPAAQEPTSQLIPRILKLVGRTSLTRQQRIPKRI